MRRYFLIHIALSGLAIFLGFRLYGIWATSSEEVHPPKNVSLKKEKSESAKVKEKGEYQVIAQKDLFRPSRTEYRPETATSLSQGPPPKLFGIMIMDNDRVAILEDSSSKKRKTYRIKDSIGDFVVSDIESNKVVLMRGEEKVVVNLREIKVISPPSRPGPVPTQSRAIQPRPAPRPIPPLSQKPPVSPAPSPPSQPAPLSPTPVPPPQPIPQTPEVMEEFPQVAPTPEFVPQGQ